MRINFTDNFDGYCQKCHDMLQEQTMEIDHTTTDKKREIGQMKGSTNFGKYIRKYSSPLEFHLCLLTTDIWGKELGKRTKTDAADQVTIKTRQKLAKEVFAKI